MRISTANAYATTIDTLQQRQQQLSRTQEQLTSGKRVARASDDPVAAARIERALATAARSDADQRALEASRSAMQQSEAALGDAGELLQRVRELVVAAGNGSYIDSDRAKIGQEIAGLRAQLLAVANRGDGAGGFLFGGQGSAEPPFSDGIGGVQFNGTAGRTEVQGGDRLPLTMDGAAAWLGAGSAADPSAPAPSVFDVLDRTVAELRSANRSSAQVAQTVQTGLRDIDASLSNLQQQRTTAGESLKHIDNAESRLADTKLHAQTQRSLAEDLDLVQALSDFQNRQTGYEAALKAYSMVQRLSLLQYL